MLGISAAVVYSTYVLTSAGVAERLGPLVLSALVCTGAATTLTLAGAAGGDLRPGNVSWVACSSPAGRSSSVRSSFSLLRQAEPIRPGHALRSTLKGESNDDG